MLINAYDTTGGAPFKVADRIESTIKTLHLMQNLSPTRKVGVYVVSHENTYDVPVFAFPITTQGHDRKTITIFDERPFRNRTNNQVVQQNELIMSRLAAYLQEDAATGNFTPVKSARLQCTKAFAEALGLRISRRATLEATEQMALKILLAYYYVGLVEDDAHELEFVATNVIREIYGADRGIILGVIEDLGHLTRLDQLLEAIKNNPTLYKLKALDFKDFLAVVGGMSFSAMSPRIIIAATEAPCLFTALTYGAASFKAYNKTPLGMALDPKYNKNSLDSFLKTIHFTYDLNG